MFQAETHAKIFLLNHPPGLQRGSLGFGQLVGERLGERRRRWRRVEELPAEGQPRNTGGSRGPPSAEKTIAWSDFGPKELIPPISDGVGQALKIA